MAACKQQQVAYIELPVGFDALTVVVNSQNNWANDITVAELKKAASDVLEIEVVGVKVAKSKVAEKRVLIQAKVIAVKRSTDAPATGENVKIVSYQLSPDDTSALEYNLAKVGPKAPPLVKQGWKGIVYLNAKDDDDSLKTYGIAAFGHSFVATTEPAVGVDAED